jgi:hypothetical protein
MRAFAVLGLLVMSSGCVVGESLDSGPAPDDAAIGAAEADGGTSAKDAGPPPSAPSDAGPGPAPSSAPPSTTDAAPPPPPPPSDAGAIDAAPTGPCAGSLQPLTLRVSGGAGSFTSNPPGISVITGGMTTACFPVGQTVVIEEASQLLCNWTGATCKDGNTADRRCEVVVGGPLSLSVVVP